MLSNKSKVVVLMGGCGNRLFQIARALDNIKNSTTSAVVNIEDFKSLYWFLCKFCNWTTHPIWIDFEVLCHDLNIKILRMNNKIRFRLILELILIKVFRRTNRLNKDLLSDGRILQVGYFQTSRSVTSNSIYQVSDTLAKNLAIENKVTDYNVIHLRAGDYNSSDILDIHDVINFSLIGDCLCITNDIGFAQRNLENINLLNCTDPLSDFISISSSKLIYPSKSTYSFWACLIAVRFHDSKIWKFPPDSYWDFIKCIISKR